MPYRRLPNTDKARLKAMKIALKKGEELPPAYLAFSQAALQQLRNNFYDFEYQLRLQKEAFSEQLKNRTPYNYLYKKSKMYISHFIQVLNLAIQRGDLKPNALSFFDLDFKEKKTQILKTEEDLIHWGHILLKGEQERIVNGGNPMTNPTIGVVKVHFEKFIEAYRRQLFLQERYAKSSYALSLLKKKIDPIILQIWNEVENFYDDKKTVEKRNLCREYGLTYFFRPKEVIPEEEKVSETYKKNRKVVLIEKVDKKDDNYIIEEEEEENNEINNLQFTLFN